MIFIVIFFLQLAHMWLNKTQGENGVGTLKQAEERKNKTNDNETYRGLRSLWMNRLYIWNVLCIYYSLSVVCRIVFRMRRSSVCVCSVLNSLEMKWMNVLVNIHNVMLMIPNQALSIHGNYYLLVEPRPIHNRIGVADDWCHVRRMFASPNYHYRSYRKFL